MKNRRAFLPVLLFLLLTLLLPAVSSASARVETEQGTVVGVVSGDVTFYKGVPYAKPPVGALRFAPPQPPEKRSAPLSCDTYGDSAPQISRPEGEPPMSEDCLYLNIWRPSAQTSGKLPVYVFIHGGAYAVGSGSRPIYDGTKFAESGIIAVTLNYRLNALGFAAPRGLKYGGNLGTLDQIEALKWLCRNIEAFGGDPENITIGGESAGAFSVSNLILSPMAKGLFRRAIMESGGIFGQRIVAPLCGGERGQAEALTECFMKSVGAEDAAALRNIPAERLVEKSIFNLTDIAVQESCYFWPVWDGEVIPRDPYGALKAGMVNGAEILLGYNQDEGQGFIPDGIKAGEYEALVRSVFGDKANEVLARYPAGEGNAPAERARFIVKMGLVLPAKIFAREMSRLGHKVYLYNFKYAPDGVKYAKHAYELMYVTGNLLPRGREAGAVSRSMHSCWVNFAANGDPNGPGSGFKWKEYGESGGQMAVFGAKAYMSPEDHSEDAAFFERLLFGE